MEQLKIDRENGMTMQQIADKHGIAVSTVRSRLLKQGVKIGYNLVFKNNKFDERRKEILKDASNHTVKELVEKYDLTDRRIRQFLRDANIKPVKSRIIKYKPVIRKLKKEKRIKKAENVMPDLVRNSEFRKVRVDKKTELYIYATEDRYSLSDLEIIKNFQKKYANR